MKKIIFFFALIVYTPISLSSNAPKISDDTKIICVDSTQQSIHDQRLVKVVNDWYSDSLTSFKPSGAQITASLKETTKSVSIPLSTYHDLFTQTDTAFNPLKISPLHAQRVKALCNYFKEQYTTNTNFALTCRYTTILTLSSSTIMLPLELCKKIAAYIEPLAFKVDILVMLRAASNGAPEKLDPHLYALYQRICPS